MLSRHRLIILALVSVIAGIRLTLFAALSMFICQLFDLDSGAAYFSTCCGSKIMRGSSYTLVEGIADAAHLISSILIFKRCFHAG